MKQEKYQVVANIFSERNFKISPLACPTKIEETIPKLAEKSLTAIKDRFDSLEELIYD